MKVYASFARNTTVFLALFFLMLAGLWFWHTIRQESLAPSAIISPATTVFAFDLHGVLFANQRMEIFKRGWNFFTQPHLRPVLYRTSFWFDLLSSIGANSMEQQFVTMIEHHPELHNQLEQMVYILNATRPIAPMHALVKELKVRGYSVYLFSNIGIVTYNQLKKIQPTIFEYFDGSVVTQPDDGWIQKPDQAAYQKFLKKFDVRPEQVLFLDDAISNITAAQKAGFGTIVVSSARAALQELKRRGVLDEKTYGQLLATKQTAALEHKNRNAFSVEAK